MLARSSSANLEAKILLLQLEQMEELGRTLHLLLHLCNEVIGPGREFQGGFFRAERVELPLVLKDAKLRIPCKRSNIYPEGAPTFGTKMFGSSSQMF